MRCKTVLVSLIAGVLLFGLISAEAQRGRGRGGFPGRGGGDFQKMRTQAEAVRAFPVEMLWAGLSFGLDLPDSQLVHIKPVIADAWAKRNGVLKIAKKDDSWERAREVLEELKEDVDEKLEVLLTKEQQKMLKNSMKRGDFSSGFGTRR